MCELLYAKFDYIQPTIDFSHNNRLPITMTSLNPDAESHSHVRRELALGFYRHFPSMMKLLDGVGVELVDDLQIPENEVINLDMQGMETGYTSCNNPRKLWDALSVGFFSLLFL